MIIYSANFEGFQVNFELYKILLDLKWMSDFDLQSIVYIVYRIRYTQDQLSHDVTTMGGPLRYELL